MNLSGSVPQMRYELAIFDIDGTLVDSGEVWSPAVQRALREVYGEEKLPLAVPSLEDLRTVIGIPGVQALHPFVPEAYRHLLPEVSRRVGDYGPEAMRAGAGRLVEGAGETLQELRRQGTWIALASNCGRSYIKEVEGTMGLAPLVDLSLCLDTSGVRSKADMVSLALETFGTRRALMVGDRRLDLEAAHANGIPFLGFAGGFGNHEEWPGAEASIRSYAEFFPLLGRREELARGLAEEILARPGCRSIGITGLPSSGKSQFAEELASAFRERKVPLRLLALEEFRLPGTEEGRGANALEHRYDLAGARRALRPAREGERVLIEGPLLFLDGIREGIDWLVALEAEEEVALRRFAGRSRRAAGPELSEGFRRSYREALELYQAEGAGRTDAVVENSNVLHPIRKR